MLLSRIKKYLVVKQQYADYLLDTFQEMKGPYTIEEVRIHQQTLRDKRKELTGLLQNHPTRKWVAGFFDGNGCLGVSYRKHTGCCYISARIVADNHYRASIDLLQKAFGGGIYTEKHKEGTYPVWVLNLPPSKAKEFIPYFAKHSIVKKDQLYFVLGCAEGGNYRDGYTIKTIMSQLKAQEQRLTDQNADVAALLRTVDFNRELKRNRPVEYGISDSPA